MTLEVFSPAKINLFLAITGRRPDGFHDLVSVVAPLDFGDTLRIEETSEGVTMLECSDRSLACDETNLVVRAAHAFRAASGWQGGVRIYLEKRIPMGAGLGGGSSNATAALLALNRLSGNKLGREALAELAARLGSDCALFLEDAPVVMRGRGERVERLPTRCAARLSGRKVLVFKPSVSISTAWAYRRMIETAPGSYLPPAEADARVQAWMADDASPAERLLYNNMEGPAFEKYIALPALLDVLRREFGVVARMSGSGSACFALLPEQFDAISPLTMRIRDAWGDTASVFAARIR